MEVSGKEAFEDAMEESSAGERMKEEHSLPLKSPF
jgi:hypothetical protein